MRTRRLLVAAGAVLALLLACATGELRGVAGMDDESGDVVSAMDLLEALAPAPGIELAPPPPAGAVYVDFHFPPSRMTTADVFRPPQV